MESQENLQLERYCFEKELFSEDMNRIWIFFHRSNKGLRDTYLFIRIMHQEENGHDFDKPIKCSVNMIVYRSLLCHSQTKIYIRVLIALGLVTRDHQTEIKDDDYESEAFYWVKEILRRSYYEYICWKFIT